ncbi:MAG: hypothetical protein ACFB3T_12925 [Geminicoccaceae bacterium]
MTEVQNANERFNQLWDEIGAKRVIIGEPDKGVEISVDADLSLFNVLDKLKEAANSGHDMPDLKESDRKTLIETADACKKLLEGNLHDSLRGHLDWLLKKRF